MPIDQTIRGLALEIDASTDPAPETQPLLEYRFIDLASTQTILARIKGIPQPNGGGQLAFETNAGARCHDPANAYRPTMAMSASERQIREPNWTSAVTRSSAAHCPFKVFLEQLVSPKSVGT